MPLKTLEQLSYDLENKIIGLDKMIKTSKEEPVESACRIEMARNIANSLRSILFGDTNNGNMNLIERCNLHKKLFFPCYDIKSSLNLLPDYKLLSFNFNGKDISVQMNDSITKTGIYWAYYLTFDAWLNEVVIETKTDNVEPISRLFLIKIISDTQGAHVDNSIEDHIYQMRNTELLPICFENEKKIRTNLEVKADSVYAETIIAIADELVISYKRFKNSRIKMECLNNFQGVVHSFSCSNKKYKIYKYSIVNSTIKTYNPNAYFESDIYCGNIYNYSIKCNDMKFKSCIIDLEYILDNKSLGKSLYGSYNYKL